MRIRCEDINEQQEIRSIAPGHGDADSHTQRKRQQQRCRHHKKNVDEIERSLFPCGGRQSRLHQQSLSGCEHKRTESQRNVEQQSHYHQCKYSVAGSGLDHEKDTGHEGYHGIIRKLTPD